MEAKAGCASTASPPESGAVAAVICGFLRIMNCHASRRAGRRVSVPLFAEAMYAAHVDGVGFRFLFLVSRLGDWDWAGLGLGMGQGDG